MADLDQLSIKITASTTDAKNKIEELIKSFQKLNGALQNYSGESAYVKGLNRLASGLRGIANASNEINPNRIKNVANSIGELATKGEKLSNLSFVKTFQQMGAESERASLRTKRAVDDIKKTFGITSKEGIEALTKSLNRFYASADDPAALASAEKEIKSLIVEYASLNEELLKTGGTLRKFMSGTNFAIPTGAVKEFGDEYKKMIGVLGVDKQHKDLSKGVGLDVVADEYNKNYGGNLDTSSALAAMESIYNALVQEREEFENLEEAQRKNIATSSELTQYMDRLYESINRVREVSSSISEGGFITGGGDADLEAIFNGEDLPQIEQTAQQVASNLNEVQKEVIETQELANPFEGIVKGVESLSGLTITAEQFGGIRVLAESLGKLVGSNGEKAGYILPQIASGLAAMSGIQLPDNAAQLAALGQALGSFGSAAATRAQGLPQLVEGLRQLQYVKIPDLNGIRDLAAALSKLGGVKVETAIQNMPRLTEAFTNMIAAISAAPTVSAETVQLAQSMAQLATASRTTGQGTTQASTGISLLRGAVGAALPTFKRAEKHTFSLASAFGKLYASYFLLIRGFRKLGDAIDYSSKLTEVQNVVAHTFGDAANKVDEFANRSIEDFGMAELSAKQFASRFQAMGTTMGISSKQIADANDLIYNKIVGNEEAYKELGDSMADVSINLTKLTADYASFYNLDYEDVADDMASIFTGQTRPMRQYGIDLTNATLQEWAMKNGLDANIKAMTQAEKTMLRYQYVMANSTHIMGDFARTKNTWANVVRTIGQQFQKLGRIIGEGLINTFKPLLIRFREFMNTILDLTEKALNAIGKLLGWQIEIEDVGVTMNDGMEDYADSVGTAADNAKKLNSQLRSIDELNNLTSPNNGDNGGGSGDAYGGGGAGENKVSGGLLNVKKYESDINSWLDLGNRIRDKIIDAITGINWEEISQKVKQNAKNLVELLKGLLLPDDEGRTLGGAIGEFLAQGINLGFDWLVTSTGDMELWGAAGNNIADFFLEFFRNLDVEDMAETINNIVEGLKTMITTAAEKLNTPENRKMIAGKIADFFKSIKPETWRTALTGLEIYLGLVTIKNISKWLVTDFLKKKVENAITDKLTAEGVGATVGQGVGIAIAISLLIDDITVTDEVAEKAKNIAEAYDIKDENGFKSPSEWWGDVKGEGWSGFFQFAKDLAKLRLGLPDTSTAYKLKNTGTKEQLGIGLLTELSELPEYTNVEEWQEYIKTLDDISERYGKTRAELRKLQKQMEEYKLPDSKDTEITPNYWGKWGENNTNYWQKWAENNKKSWIDIPKQLGEEFFGEGSLLYESVVRPFKEMGEDSATDYAEGLNGQMELEAPGMNANMGMFGAGAGTALNDGMSLGLTLLGEKISTWWNENVAPWFTKEKWQEFGENAKLGLSTKWDEFTQWWQNTGFYQWWTDNVAPWFTKEKWQGLGDNIKQGLTGKWNEFTAWWQNTGFYQWWTTKVQPYFTKEKWSTMGDNIKNGLTEKWNSFKTWWDNTGLKNWIDETTRKFNKLRDDLAGENGFFTKLWQKAEEAWNNIKKVFEETTFNIKLPHISWDSKNTYAAPEWMQDVLKFFNLPTSIPQLKVEWYADGGFPTPGSLFVAGEAGAEMLGTVGGKTAVASNGEITGISDTIRSTSSEEIRLLKQQNQLLQGILEKEFGISRNNLYKEVRAADIEHRKMTGQSGFAY